MDKEDGAVDGTEWETGSQARENTRRDNKTHRTSTGDGVTPSALSIEGLDKDSILNLMIPHSRKRTRQVWWHSLFSRDLGPGSHCRPETAGDTMGDSASRCHVPTTGTILTERAYRRHCRTCILMDHSFLSH